MIKKYLNKKLLLKLLNVFLTLAVVYFCFIYGDHLLDTADFSTLKDRWWMLILALILFLGYYLLAAIHWLWVCRIVKKNVGNSQAVAYAASQPYKYLPTNIFSVSYRAVYAKQLGMPLRDSTYAQLIENFNIVGSGIGVTVLFYAWYLNWMLGASVTILAAAVLGLCVYYKLTLAVPFTKNKYKIHTYSVIPSFLLMASAWFVGGVSFWLTAYSAGLPINFLLAISANAAGFVVSILAVFAPGGIGVRELTLSLFGVQNSAVVLWRLLTFTVDIVVGGVIVILLKTKKIR